MERTQRIAARFITGDYRSTTPGSVTRPLKKTNLQPLQERRQLLCLTLFYRVVEELVPAQHPNLKIKNDSAKTWYIHSREPNNNMATSQRLTPQVTA